MDSLGGAGLGAGGSDFGCGCGFQPLASLAAVLSRPPGALFPLSRPRAGALPSTCSHPALQTPGCAPGSLQWARGFWTWAILLPSLKPMSDHAIAQRSVWKTLGPGACPGPASPSSLASGPCTLLCLKPLCPVLWPLPASPLRPGSCVPS